MKHSVPVTFLLVVLFVLAQVVGLVIVHRYAVVELPFGLQPPALDPATSFVPLFIMILLVTVIALFVMRFRLGFLWKFWFILSLVVTLSVALASFLPELIAILVALVLTFLKLWRPSVVWHNLPEVFLYAGLAAIFAPVLSLFSISVLLILIAVYDAIAVWKTKHMVAMAEYQTKSKLFAGLYIPYKKKFALLGGGDIGFPLLFNAVLLRQFGWFSLISVGTTAGALLWLLLASKKGKFYPAMPFLAAGCFVGLGIILLIV
ncbi:MAG: presenilin family intramembrane aspartyl protease [Nanoarchaeota archaeon]|nr:presenilin family intramembrane aspartyl protease [Nanoarchaeota archaeon]